MAAAGPPIFFLFPSPLWPKSRCQVPPPSSSCVWLFPPEECRRSTLYLAPVPFVRSATRSRRRALRKRLIHHHHRRFLVSATPTCFPSKHSGPPHSSTPPWTAGSAGARHRSPCPSPTVERHPPIHGHRLTIDRPHGWVPVPPLLPGAFSLDPSCSCRRLRAAGATVPPCQWREWWLRGERHATRRRHGPGQARPAVLGLRPKMAQHCFDFFYFFSNWFSIYISR
jgi:hypothetical protein